MFGSSAEKNKSRDAHNVKTCHDSTLFLHSNAVTTHTHVMGGCYDAT